MVKKRKASLTARPSSGKGRGRGGAGAVAPASAEAKPHQEITVSERLRYTNTYLSIISHNLRLLVRVASDALAAPKGHPKGDGPISLSLPFTNSIETTRACYPADDGREEGDIPTCDADSIEPGLRDHVFPDIDDEPPG